MSSRLHRDAEDRAGCKSKYYSRSQRDVKRICGKETL